MQFSNVFRTTSSNWNGGSIVTPGLAAAIGSRVSSVESVTQPRREETDQRYSISHTQFPNHLNRYLENSPLRCSNPPHNTVPWALKAGSYLLPEFSTPFLPSLVGWWGFRKQNSLDLFWLQMTVGEEKKQEGQKQKAAKRTHTHTHKTLPKKLSACCALRTYLLLIAAA
jgi:hypothetical protein